MNYRAIRNIRNNTNEILDDNNEVVASINLDTNNYKDDRKSFEEITELLSENVRKIVRSGNGSLDFLSDYRKN